MGYGLQKVITSAIALVPAGCPPDPTIDTRHAELMVAWKLPVLLPGLLEPMMLLAETAATTAEGVRPAVQAGVGTVTPFW